ncbi:MAG: response regulator [Deltaproteobacteria bacterium]|nr:response regulator [Deltaproteobacteria bacterium]
MDADNTRVRQLLNVANRIAAGDFTARMELSTENDDLDALGNAINAIATKSRDANLKFHRTGAPKQRDTSIVSLDAAHPEWSTAETEQNRKMIEGIFENAPLVMAVVDRDGRILRMNHAGVAVSRREQDELRGLQIGETLNCKAVIDDGNVCGESEECETCGLRNAISEAFSSGKTIRKLPVEFIAQEGATPIKKFLQVSISVLNNPDQILVSLDDVTVQREQEHRLKESERALAQAQRIAQLGNFEWDVVTRAFSWSEELYELCGIDPHSPAPNMDVFMEHVHPEDRLALDASFKWMVDTGNDGEIEYRILLQDGTFRIVHQKGKVITDGNNNSVRLFGIVQDVTALREAEQAVRESEQNLQQVINTLPIGVAIVDTVSYFPVMANKVMLQLCELESCELQNLIGIDVIADVKHRNAVVQIMKEKKSVFDTEMLLRKQKTGTAFWGFVSLIPMTYSSSSCILVTLSDATERMEARKMVADAKEKAEEANKLKSAFLANMSHEIRTPLNAVMGLTGLLARTSLTKVQSEYLRKIQTSSSFLLGIINNILDFSKIEAGMMQLEIIAFEIDDLTRPIFDTYSHQVLEKGLAFSFEFASDIPDTLEGDVFHIKQILCNFVSNAIKFTEKGHITIGAQILAQSHNSIMVEFYVRDSGVGMRGDEAARIFDAFQQADQSTTRRFGGTGLGLSICKHLTSLMGGEIGVDCERGKGSKFFVSLPLGVCQSEPISPRNIAKALQQMHVLLVYEHGDAPNAIIEYLHQFGYRVDVVDSFDKALVAQSEQLKKNPYRLIIINHTDAFINESSRVPMLRMSTPGGEAPRVILICTHWTQQLESMAQAQTLQVDACLLSPFSRATLHDTICNTFHEQLRSHSISPIPEEGTALDLHDQRILLAEDNELNQEVALGLLRETGANVTVVNNGIEVLFAIKRCTFDIILMDIHMPEMDGFQAATEIRKRNITGSGGHYLPIIALTANVFDEYRQSAMNAGMDDYLTKPVAPQQLYQVLRRWRFATKSSNGDWGGKVGRRLTRTSVVQPRQPVPTPVHPAGIDVNAALARVGGSQRHLLKLLKRFAEKQANVVDEIRSHWQQGEKDTALRLAHTLKGLAGTIGANPLQQVATKAEAALRSGEPNALSPLLDDLQKALGDVISGISQMETSESAKPTAILPQPPIAYDHHQTEAIVQKLAQDLIAGDISALKQIAELEAAGLPQPVQDALASTRKAVHQYDFDNALEHLSILAQDLNLHLGTSGTSN